LKPIDGQIHDVFKYRSDRVFYCVNGSLIILLTLIVLLPLINILASSFSAPAAVSAGKVLLWPIDIGLEGYKKVFVYPLIWNSYLNTVVYTVAGTAINITVTMFCAYPLARKTLPLKGVIMFLFTFSVMFNAGMIPNYMLLRSLSMIDTRWAMLIPGALSVYNMIIARTFIQNITTDMWDAATIDGCSDTQYFIHVVIPLSRTLISVLALFYAVAHWNSYFDAFLYLSSRRLFPLQILLREILIANSIRGDQVMDPDTLAAMVGMADLIKYALIVVSCAPILMLYPFLQKFFVKGLMIGSVKG
jgi:putative aldouronate transport system permease protein